MNASATSRSALQSCLVFHSMLDLLQKNYFLANFNSSIISLQNPKEHEQKRWESRRRRAGEIAFVYQNNKEKWIDNIGGQIIVICIWKIGGKGYICLENQAFSTLNRPLCHKVNLLSYVARQPLSGHRVNLPSCVARRPLGHKANLPRCEARWHHLTMTCDIFGTRQTNTLTLCYLWRKTY